MSADLIHFPIERLPPEAPVRRDLTIEMGLRSWLAVETALRSDPSHSELIDQLVHTTDPNERQALADAIRSTAP